MIRMPVLLVTLLAVASCDRPQADASGVVNSQRPEAAETISRAESVEGNYPAFKQVGAANEIPNELFKSEPIPCDDERTLVNALWALSKSQMAASANATMVDYGVDDVALKDGPGRIAAVEYTFEPGDEGVVSRATDFYLLNEGCRALYWKYVGP